MRRPSLHHHLLLLSLHHMGKPSAQDDYAFEDTNGVIKCAHRVPIPPPQPFTQSFAYNLKETLFPDDPFRQFKGQSFPRKLLLALQFIFPILEWGPRYSLKPFKSDLISGITIASLAIPQGISYAKLTNLPPIIGLYSSFVPPVVYAIMGTSRDMAVGTVAVASLLLGAMLSREVNANVNPALYFQLAITSTFFAGVFQASLGFLRLGFIVDFLSHSTIVGFMGGAATVVCLQQLKGILGLSHFTHSTDIISVMKSVILQTHQWKWESALLGFCFLFFLLTTKYFSKKKPRFFWVSAIAPLTSVIMGSILVYLSHAENHGVQVIGQLKKGLNPPSSGDLIFTAPYLMVAIKTGIVTGIVALAEGIAAGRSFAMLKNYTTDGNKEMIAIGTMNMVGSCTSCYLTTGAFSRSAVNVNAGCKTAVSNLVMAVTVMVTLLFLTPLFHYTPLVVLSSIIISAIIGLIDYEAAIHLFHVDKFDFVVCMSAYIGVVFANVEVGLVLAVALSVLRVILFVARPRTFALGNIKDSMIFRNVDHYTNTESVPGILVLTVNGPIYFASSSYLRERLLRWIEEEEIKIKSMGEPALQYVLLDMGAVGNIDTSGMSMLEEVNKSADRKGIKLGLCNPGAEVMKKLHKSKIIDLIGESWIYSTVGEAVEACEFLIHSCASKSQDKACNV